MFPRSVQAAHRLLILTQQFPYSLSRSSRTTLTKTYSTPHSRPLSPFFTCHLTTMSTNNNKAAFLESEKGPFVVRSLENHEPGEKEVLIKVQACAFQPADAKVAKLAIFPMEYPTILGSPVSGTVEALGPGVNKVAVGDRVVCGTKILVHKKIKYGGMQRFCVVDESEVISIGEKVEFKKAVALASYTPPGALFGKSALNMSYPKIPASNTSSAEGKKILIWGGSSAMGSLSISYAKAAGYTVISTSSPHNFKLLEASGADYVFDHSDAATVEKIRKLFPIDYWFDTISVKQSFTSILQILAPGNGEPVTKADVLALLPLAFAGMKDSDLPEGVTIRMHRFSTHSEENKEWNEYFLAKGGFMEKAVQTGALKGVPEHVLGGLEQAGEGIEMLDKGVSGRKIVIEPWA